MIKYRKDKRRGWQRRSGVGGDWTKSTGVQGNAVHCKVKKGGEKDWY